MYLPTFILINYLEDISPCCFKMTHASEGTESLVINFKDANATALPKRFSTFLFHKLWPLIQWIYEYIPHYFSKLYNTRFESSIKIILPVRCLHQIKDILAYYHFYSNTSSELIIAHIMIDILTSTKVFMVWHYLLR